MSKCKVVPIVLCGGAGSRLWPLSRTSLPKPFLKVKGQSLISRTVQRIANHFNEEDLDLLFVSNQAYEFLLADELEGLKAEADVQFSVHQLLEPQGRNTAGAIALAAKWALDAFSDYDQVSILVFPADHIIDDNKVFSDSLNAAITSAQGGFLTCFGIKPTSPETGFGYVLAGESTGLANARRVEQFVEKPDLERAVEYIQQGDYFWNAGMFAFDASVLLNQMEVTAPEVYAACCQNWERAQKKDDRVRFEPEMFSEIPDISIDYALMEKSNQVALIPSEFGWTDVGSFQALSELHEGDSRGNVFQSMPDDTVENTQGVDLWVSKDCSDSHVIADKRLVATLGLKNLLIVDTPDALLVADRDRHQDVKSIVSALKVRAESDVVDFHRTVHRPWGTYTVLDSGMGYKIKRIEVKPNASLSLQMHHHRSEHWIVVSGTAEVTNGENVVLVTKNESTYIPAGNKHRLKNPGVIPLVMIEVQSGEYLEEDDIVRFDDQYGRVL